MNDSSSKKNKLRLLRKDEQLMMVNGDYAVNNEMNENDGR